MRYSQYSTTPFTHPYFAEDAFEFAALGMTQIVWSQVTRGALFVLVSLPVLLLAEVTARTGAGAGFCSVRFDRRVLASDWILACARTAHCARAGDFGRFGTSGRGAGDTAGQSAGWRPDSEQVSAVRAAQPIAGLP